MTRKTINLGKTARGTSFTVPMDVIVEASAVLGRRGSGKTNTAKRIVEGALAGRHQVIVLDPLDVWWGLKADAAGKAAGGLDVLLIGDPRKPHTDMPLREADGASLADLLVDEALPCVVSMRHLSKSARRRFAADFLERLFHRKGDPGKDTACLLAIDEASMFVPQTQREPEQARLVGAAEACVRQGRSAGLGIMLIDQRAASVNKDVLTQVELFIVHQLTGPQDRKAVKDWIDENAAIDADQVRSFMESLSSLAIPRGDAPRSEAWFWSPSWLETFERVMVQKASSYDSSKTPRPGERAVTAASVAAYDLNAVREKWDQVIQQAEQDDPKKLRAQLARLQAELRKRDATPAAAVVDDDAVDRAVRGSLAERDDWWRGKLAMLRSSIGSSSRLREMADQLDGVVDSVRELESAAKASSNGHARAARPKPAPARSPRSARPPAPSADPSAGGQVTGPQQKILDAYAWWHSIGVDRPTRQNVAPLAGYRNIRSSGFRNPLYELHSAGLVADDALTDAGLQSAAWPATSDSLSGYHAKLKAVLDGPSAKLLDAVVDLVGHAGGVVSRDELAAATGYTNVRSSGFRNPLYRLSSMSLVELTGADVEATGLLFPEGLG